MTFCEKTYKLSETWANASVRVFIEMHWYAWALNTLSINSLISILLVVINYRKPEQIASVRVFIEIHLWAWTLHILLITSLISLVWVLNYRKPEHIASVWLFIELHLVCTITQSKKFTLGIITCCIHIYIWGSSKEVYDLLR